MPLLNRPDLLDFIAGAAREYAALHAEGNESSVLFVLRGPEDPFVDFAPCISIAVPDVTNDEEAEWVAREVVEPTIRSAHGSIACLGQLVHIQTRDREWVDAAMIIGADRDGRSACLTGVCDEQGDINVFEDCLQPAGGVWLDGLLAGLTG
jgi:hypothetical protein